MSAKPKAKRSRFIPAIIFIINLSFSYFLITMIAGEFLSSLIALKITLVLLFNFLISYIPYFCIKDALSSIRDACPTIIYIKVALFLFCAFLTDALIRFSNIKTDFAFSGIMTYATIFFYLYYVFSRTFIEDSGRYINDMRNYKKELDEKIRRKKKGDYGENTVQFHLKHLEHSEETPFKIINGKYFSFKGHVKAQIDHVVICRKGVFLLETKNHDATIVVAKSGDWLKKLGNMKFVPYNCNPSGQCSKHHIVIKDILYSSGFCDIKIVDLIVLANQSQHVYSTENSKIKIVKVDNLLELFTHDDNYPNVLEDSQIEGICKVLTSSEVEGNKYDIKIMRALLHWAMRLPKTYAIMFSITVFIFLNVFSINTLATNTTLFKEPKIVQVVPELQKMFIGKNIDAYGANNESSKALEALVENQPGDTLSSLAAQEDPEPNFYFNVASHKTYIAVKDGRKMIFHGKYSEGTRVNFYKDKSIIKIDPDGSKESFTAENDILDLEVANNYTEVYHNGDLHKSLRQFRYDIVKNEIIK